MIKFYIVIGTVDGEWSFATGRFGSGVSVFFGEQEAVEYIKKNQAARVSYKIVELKGREVPYTLPTEP